MFEMLMGMFLGQRCRLASGLFPPKGKIPAWFATQNELPFSKAGPGMSLLKTREAVS